MHGDAVRRTAFTEEMNVDRRFPRRMITLFKGDEVPGNG
jgi:hypothetical protein